MTRLGRQPWMTSDGARRVMTALDAARPGSARFVGGCVRDALLGIPVADIDIATQLTPDRVEAAMRAADIAVHATGLEHGTLTVVADHQPFEVTTLRRDVETDGRRATVAFTEDWAEDAQRRDFRINALYADAQGEVFDPTGGGLDDLAAGRVVFVGDPETRIREDYLRILRFFRFSARFGAGALDPAGLAACAKLKAGLSQLSAERVWMEMRKLMTAAHVDVALEAMAATGVLAELFPEATLHVAKALLALEREEGLQPDGMLRFLALFWESPQAVRAVANRLKVSNAEKERLTGAAEAKVGVAARLAPAEQRRALYLLGKTAFADRVRIAWALDRRNRDAWRKMLALAESWPRPRLPVGGEDLLARGFRGPQVGEALKSLEAAWIESDFTLSREALLGRLARP
jgi:poly(A) polymerase